MIIYVQGDLFQSPAKVLVNPVNTVGVMGKGLAAEFKRFYPQMFEQYAALCKEKRFDVGQLYLYRTPHKWVLNFPTKKHWRERSEIEYLQSGLQKFVAVYAEQGMTSVSFAAIGTGEGGLDWQKEVRPLMEAYLDPLPILVYVHSFDENAVQRNPRSVANWLNGNPQDVSFDKMWRDLLRLIKRKNTFETQDEITFSAVQEEKARSRSLVISAEDEHIFLSESMLADLWGYIRGAGYCLPDNLPSGLEQYAPYLVALFSHLDYVRPVELSTNHQQWQTGIHYMPPLQKDTANAETNRTATLR